MSSGLGQLDKAVRMENNNRTATSVDSRWINASVTRVIDHPRGYVISRWTAARIAHHWNNDSVAQVNNYL